MQTEKTALILIDPYNDFLSVLGKSWLLNRATLKGLGTNDNLARALAYCRKTGIAVCYAPHARYRKGLFDQRRYLNPSAYLAAFFQTFSQGAWGGRFRKSLQPQEGEFVAKEHLISSGFVGTDLHDHLRSKSITDVILCGCLSNTCVESTARSAIELGYRVTILSDALAAMSLKDHEAALSSGYKICAHQVIPTSTFVAGKAA